MTRFSIVLVLALLLFVSARALKLTRERCSFRSECQPPRRCYDTEQYKLCAGGDACECIPPDFQLCSASSECVKGEVCARTPESPFQCISTTALATRPLSVTVEVSKKKPLIPKCPVVTPGAVSVPGSPPMPDIAPPENGVNKEPCSPGTCASGLSCVELLGSSSAIPFRCLGKEMPIGICHPMDTRGSCDSALDCSKKEACAKTAILAKQCVPMKSLKSLSKAGQKTAIIYNKSGRPRNFIESGGGGGRTPTTPPTPSATPVAVSTSPSASASISQTPSPSEAPPSPSPSKPASSSPAQSASSTPTAMATASEPQPSPSESSTPTPEQTDLTNGTEPSATPEGVCVAVHHLNGMDRSALVFEHDRLARVLCDELNNCATPGHMVVYSGSAMMMQSYCRIATCTAQIMKVNSPRYSRALRLGSSKAALSFTAFAARWQTRAEEHGLRQLLRIGL